MIIPFSVKHYRYLLCLGIALISLSGAAIGEPLIFEPKGIHQQSTLCEEGLCAKFDIVFMRATKGATDEILGKINTRIERRLIDVNQPIEVATLEDRAKEFVSSFQDLLKEGEVGADAAWHITGELKESFSSPSILSLRYGEEGYAGGAHGYSRTIFLTFNLVTGDELAIDDLFGLNHEALFAAGEKAFRKTVEIDPKMSFAEAGYFYPSGTFALSKEWGVSKDGIILYFNEYEAAPYAEGPIEVLLEKKDIAPLLDNKKGWAPLFSK